MNLKLVKTGRVQEGLSPSSAPVSALQTFRLVAFDGCHSNRTASLKPMQAPPLITCLWNISRSRSTRSLFGDSVLLKQIGRGRSYLAPGLTYHGTATTNATILPFAGLYVYGFHLHAGRLGLTRIDYLIIRRSRHINVVSTPSHLEPAGRYLMKQFSLTRVK